MLETAIADFTGDLAEVRVYNRAVTDAERVILQNHLAARYGLTLEADDVYAGKDAANGDCDLDVVGIGRTAAAEAGDIPGAISVSEASAGLTLAALNGTLNGDGEYLLAGHAGAANAWVSNRGETPGVARRWRRAWYLDRTGTGTLDARLTFSAADAGVAWLPAEAEPVYRLLWRADAASAFTDTGLEAAPDGDTLVFDVPDAVLTDGLYTVGAQLPTRGTLILLK
jgi:hypothetical protein